MLKIGPYSFEHQTILAPMAGITDSVFRTLCRQNGATYTFSEMVASKKSLWESKKSSTRHANNSDPEPRAVQLIGTKPEELAEAAIWQVSQGAQIIDFNMGCPAKKVCSIAAGSALMGDPGRVSEIFEALVNAVDIPITVKTRTGTDSTHCNAIEIAQLAQEKGLQAVTIHGRTRADRFRGLAEYDTIKMVKQAVNIPVIANGDICTPEQAQFVLEYTSADAVMIGRATQGYPWLFREMNHYLKTGLKIEKPTFNTFYKTIIQHISGLHQLYGNTLSVCIARKHIGWYGQHLPKGIILRKKFNQLLTANMQLDLIKDYFADKNLNLLVEGNQK